MKITESRFQKIADYALILFSTLRLTRFITSDTLGGWLLADPAQQWADKYELKKVELKYALEDMRFGEKIYPLGNFPAREILEEDYGFKIEYESDDRETEPENEDRNPEKYPLQPAGDQLAENESDFEYQDSPEPLTWQGKLVSGLECPFCVGTWVGFAVLATYFLTRKSRGASRLWRFVAGGLSLNYCVGHISSRLD